MRSLVITTARGIIRIDEPPAELERLSRMAEVECVLNIERMGFDEDCVIRYEHGRAEQFRAEYIPALRARFL